MGKVIGLVAILSVLAYFGLDFSGVRPAWAYEHKALAKEFYADKCCRFKNEWYKAKEIESQYIQRLEAVPNWLVGKIITLERAIKRVCGD